MKAVKTPLFSFLTVLIVLSPFLFNCTQTTTSDSESSTLKIGFIGNFGWELGLDTLKGIEIMAEADNKAGGISVGDKKYQVEIISYDSAMDQAKAIAAANRLIFKDKVKYIISDPLYIPALLQITDPNKILLIAGTPGKENLKPEWHYSWMTAGTNFQVYANVVWFVKNYPKEAKNWVIVYPDNATGRMAAEDIVKPVNNIIGVAPEMVSYPDGTMDFSAIATTVTNMKPSVVTAYGMGTNEACQCIKALRSSGYKGLLFGTTQSIVYLLVDIMPLDQIEGLLAGADVFQFDPPLTEEAKEFKAAWIEKEGEFVNPLLTFTTFYPSLIAAIKKAGSLDQDKIKAVLDNGFSFTAPLGKFQMVARPDFNNDRTVDSISTTYIAIAKNGKNELYATIDTETGYEYWKEAVGIK